MAMMGGVGAGGSGGGDEPWGSRAGNGNCNGNGKPTWMRERENERRRERRRRVIVLRILAALRENGNYTLPRNYDKNNLLMAVCKPLAGDQQMADIGGSSAPVNPGGRASYYGLTRPPSPKGITLGSRGSGGADPVPAWLKNLSKQLSDKSYPNFLASSSNSNSNDAPEDSSPPSSPPRRRKMARYTSPPPPTPPSSPARATSNVLPPPWATGAAAGRYSFQTSTPPLMSMSPVTGARAPGSDPWATGADASDFSIQTSIPTLMSPVTGARAPGPDPWATGADASDFSIPTLMSPVTGNRAPGPDPLSLSLLPGFQISSGAGANTAPARSSFTAPGAGSSASSWMLPLLSSSGASASAVRGRGGVLMNPLGFSFRGSGGEQAAGAREEEEVMPEMNADGEEESLELTLGNVQETREDRA